MITYERVREALHYDPETGVFTWRVKGNNRVRLGDEAGSTVSTGRRSIQLDGRKYKAHQLAWLYMTGTWPEHEIDHVNGLPGDNRFVNLRDEPRTTNMRNQVAPRRDSVSGFRGVSPHEGRWQADIRVDGKKKYLGLFDTPEEASAAYWAAKAELHGEETYQVRLDQEVMSR